MGTVNRPVGITYLSTTNECNQMGPKTNHGKDDRITYHVIPGNVMSIALTLQFLDLAAQ
jgi:hypothetical protein